MSTKKRKEPPMLPIQNTSKVLFVGELPTNLSSAALQNNLHPFFEKMIGFQSLSVQLNKCSKPLGHAYVNFTTPKQAEDALKELRFKIIIQDKQCTLMHKRDRNNIKISPECTLHVQNLDNSVSEDELFAKFSQFDIINCKISRNQNTYQSNGYGYISFQNKTDAQKAMQNINGTKLKGKTLKVQQFIPKSQRQSMRQYTTTFTNIYVKNLPSWMTEKQLISMFEKGTNGKIDSSFISQNRKSQTFALLNFMTTEQAIEAISKFNGQLFAGKSLYVARAETREERDFKLAQSRQVRIVSRTNLKIKNLARTVNARILFNKFKSFGRITRHSVHGTYGFVEFLYPQHAKNAICVLNNTIFHNRRIIVSFAKESKRNKRNINFDMNHHFSGNNHHFSGNNHHFLDHMSFQNQFEANLGLLFNDEKNEMKHEQNNVSDLNSLSDLAKERLLKKDLSSKIQDLLFCCDPDCAIEIVEELLKLDEEILMGLRQNDAELRGKAIKIKSKLSKNELKEDNVVNAEENNEIEKEEKKVDIEFKDERKELNELNAEENKQINDEPDEVEDWVNNIVKLPKYIKHFLLAGFEDLETIKTMNEDDLKKIEIDILGHRRKFLIYIRKLKTSKDNYPDEGIKM